MNLEEENDHKKNLLFIGANDMVEIESYVKEYQNGLFIEAIPNVFAQLEANLQKVNNKYNTNYKALNCLVSDQVDKEYTFNIFDNNGASSSIYEPNPEQWQWSWVNKIGTIKLKSTTVDIILKEQHWENIKYDLVLDVQGAELDVLKGCNEKNMKNIEKITTEVSTEQFYKGGVLFDELNTFILNCGFKIDIVAPPSNHCDLTYIRA